MSLDPSEFARLEQVARDAAGAAAAGEIKAHREFLESLLGHIKWGAIALIAGTLGVLAIFFGKTWIEADAAIKGFVSTSILNEKTREALQQETNVTINQILGAAQTREAIASDVRARVTEIAASTAVAELQRAVGEQFEKLEAMSDEQRLQLVKSVPVGTILAFAGESIPADAVGVWRLCDGSELSRTDYEALYTAIGTSWGNPKPGWFNLPELRGRFLRGVDQGLNQDPDAKTRERYFPGGNVGDAVGTVQNDALQNHRHDIVRADRAGSYAQSLSIHGDKPVSRGDNSEEFNFETRKVVSGRVANETRPRNASVQWIIKVR